MTIHELLFYDVKYTGQYILQTIKQNCGLDFYRKVNAYQKLQNNNKLLDEQKQKHIALKTYLGIYEFLCSKIFKNFEIFFLNEFQNEAQSLYQQQYQPIYNTCVLTNQYLVQVLQDLNLNENTYFIYNTCYVVISELKKLTIFLHTYVS